jgi:hypothetical protein
MTRIKGFMALVPDGEIGSGEIVAVVPADGAVAVPLQNDAVEEGEAVEESAKWNSTIFESGHRKELIVVQRGRTVCPGKVGL